MESRAKLFGHPIHQMLVVLPLGLLIGAVVFDILYLVFGNRLFAAVSFYNIAGGVISGLLAAVFGIIDFSNIPGGTRAKRVGTAHMFGNLIVIVLFAWSWIIRNSAVDYAPPTIALVLSFLGVGIGAVTAWLGGELVDRLGVGVDPGANLNAPSSLSGQPAHAVPAGLQPTMMPVTGESVERDEP